MQARNGEENDYRLEFFPLRCMPGRARHLVVTALLAKVAPFGRPLRRLRGRPAR